MAMLYALNFAVEKNAADEENELSQTEKLKP